MGNDLIAYIERLELMAFFSAYPLFYALIGVISTSSRIQFFSVGKAIRLLPVTYALCGTLYLGLQMRNLYPDFPATHLGDLFNSWLKIWGLLALLFWIPLFQKKPLLSLVHSLVFFFFLLKDLCLHLVNKTAKEVVKNDMKIFTDSLLLIAVIFIVLCAANLIFSAVQKKSGRA